MIDRPKPVKRLSRQIEKVEKKEKKGAHGQWRKAFCKQYLDQLGKTRSNAYNALLDELNLKGESITCRRGCTHCCYHYVTVSLAHGIVIVDYLYRRKDLLRKYLENYEKWHDKGGALSEKIDQVRHRSLSSSVPIDQVLANTRPLSMRYLETHIRCPFLMKNRCAIYPVRPPSCAGHYSVTNPDWCSLDTPQEAGVYNAISSDEDLIKTAQLTGPELVLFELSLPIMIYRLLTEGSAAMIGRINAV